MCFDAAQVAHVRAAITVVESATRREEGNVEYAFAEDLVTAGCMRLFEVWTTDDALSQHARTTHVATFRAAVRPWLRSADVRRYDVSAMHHLT